MLLITSNIQNKIGKVYTNHKNLLPDAPTALNQFEVAPDIAYLATPIIEVNPLAQSDRGF